MHKDFIACCPDDCVSYSYYQNKVKNLNISSVKLGEEECEVYELLMSHLKEEHMLSEIEHTQSADGRKNKKVFPNCAKCDTIQKHAETATEAQSSDQNEKVRVLPSNEMVVSTDMQKEVMFLRLPSLKQSIFCKRLALFNETFAPIGKSEMKLVGVLWHEAIKDRSAEDVASTFTFLFTIFEIAKNLFFERIIVLVRTRNGFFTLFLSTRLIVSMVQ